MRHFCNFVHGLGFAQSPLGACSLMTDPRFHYSLHGYQLGDEAKKRVYEYLSTQTLFLSSYGQLERANFVLGFSFGDSHCINRKLANLARTALLGIPNLSLYLQQEIALHCANLPLVSIGHGDYQTTLDVATKAKQRHIGNKVVVLAQAWHAQRCIETCQSVGLNVVALRVVNGFAANDPQPWVRNPINWVIKESHRHMATGDEISLQYQLV